MNAAAETADAEKPLAVWLANIDIYDSSPGAHIPLRATRSDFWMPAGSIAEAQSIVRAYIEECGLGYLHWSGGEVRAGNVPLGRVDHAGRWHPHDLLNVAGADLKPSLVIVKLNEGQVQGAVTNVPGGVDVLVLDYDIDAQNDDVEYAQYPEPLLRVTDVPYCDEAGGYCVAPLFDPAYTATLASIHEAWEKAEDARTSPPKPSSAPTP